ncbi:HlyD family type I secretion periplasmic adaptor subunit [Pseudomonas gingeri]|uniref:Membrane fusion protein (MFP) family protein n=1 Tax=Pseudomonas gingeri TaxID=117681 RepID=A0A7Y8C3M2_9PSED|nr:HlyD family type I secretion periplasmic adaptor subunit [Pseudomonas gingeri]NWB98373.1 HlyD family type I secretion periplasmic adaptor subunit [Pseudomonas gingeri]
MNLRWDAVRELLQRYTAHLGHAWARRAEMDAPPRLSHELQFLPSALSLQETPVHPAPRIAMQLILAFAVLVLLWSIVGKIDIVATASGKIIPNARTKVIQPLEAAIVRAIHVSDGQKVKAGEVLIELDATTAQADTDRTHIDWQQTQLDAARAQAVLDMLTHDKPVPAMSDPLNGAEPEKYKAAQRMAVGQYAEYRTKWQQLSAELTQHESERAAILENEHKLEATLPIAMQRENDLKDLLDKNYVARHDYLDKKQARIEMERDLASAKAKLTELDAVILTTQRQKEALTAETQRMQLDQLHDAEQKMGDYKQEYIKANSHREAMTLTAPVDGTVQQLAIHTIGGVVTPAQQLMQVVPLDSALDVEAFVQNKDIGFVNEGQDAQIKIETFPFTKYGTIQGTVLRVSNDAVQEDPKQTQTNDSKTNSADNRDKPSGLVYTARVQMAKNTMDVDGKIINLTPGMAVTVEIKTGKRRLIDYFLSPLMQYKNESLKER